MTAETISISTVPRDMNVLTRIPRGQLIRLAVQLHLLDTDALDQAFKVLPPDQQAQQVYNALIAFDASGGVASPATPPQAAPPPQQQQQQPAYAGGYPQQYPPGVGNQQPPYQQPAYAPPQAPPPQQPAYQPPQAPPPQAPPYQQAYAPPQAPQAPPPQQPTYAPPQAPQAYPPPPPAYTPPQAPQAYQPPAGPPQAPPPQVQAPAYPPPSPMPPSAVRQPQTASDPSNTGTDIAGAVGEVMRGILKGQADIGNGITALGKGLMLSASVQKAILQLLLVMAEQQGMDATTVLRLVGHQDPSVVDGLLNKLGVGEGK